MMKTFLPAAILALCVASSYADIKLPAIFSDHMVVQSGTEIPVWGWAEQGEAVTVTLGDQSASATTDAQGKWTVKLGKLQAADEPQTLTVKGANTLVVKDVLVGEVWLASGQSNMAFLFSRGEYPEPVRQEANLPKLRVFTVKQNSTRTPQQDCEGAWVIASPETVADFSAVAYFFGQELYNELKAPVGMIVSAWGGTDIAAWTSEEVQLPNSKLKANLRMWEEQEKNYDPVKAKAAHEKQTEAWKKKVAAAKAANQPLSRRPSLKKQPSIDQNHPANLFNGMIAPLIPYALRGAIWYQGEHNCSSLEKASLYAEQLPMLIQDWRTRWGHDLAFAWVQLPNFEQKAFRPLVREAMLKTLAVKNTGMAITTDIGEPNDNHPKNKPEVGRRLSLWALGTVYHKPVASTSGPLPLICEAREGHIAITFKHADEGLVAKGSELKGFEIAGADKVWKPATAKIAADEVLVSSPEVPKPAAVRYSWSSNPVGNLYNGAGLPASPFRTDDWEVTAN
ncbi:MAG TPA: sialate O-acetylesterase [Prosthecobacter sp.]|nr:sialate O-acetylesterase [Prosthecobacter sp.]